VGIFINLFIKGNRRKKERKKAQESSLWKKVHIIIKMVHYGRKFQRPLGVAELG
jgi:hypothetical protein